MAELRQAGRKHQDLCHLAQRGGILRTMSAWPRFGRCEFTLRERHGFVGDQVPVELQSDQVLEGVANLR